MLRNVLIGLLGLIVLFVLGAYLTPRHIHVERSVEIYASAEQIFPYLNSYEAFNEWSPWYDRDPDAEYTYSGPPSGVGAQMSWSGDESVGVGAQEITLSEFPTRLETYLDFGAQGDAHAFFDLESTDGGTLVTWGFDTDMGMNPISRYVGLLMDGLIGADYEEGLMNLRNLVEDQTSVPRTPDGEPMQLPVNNDANDTMDDANPVEEPGDDMSSDAVEEGDLTE